MYKYVLFDLDGTITEPFEGITNCIVYALEHLGIKVEDRNELRPFIGPPLFDQFKAQFHFDDDKARAAVAKYRERYSAVGWKECSINEGTEELLKSLKAAGKTVALATSKPEKFAEKILEHFGLAKYFDFIGGAELNEAGRTKKSDIIAYVKENLGIKNPAEAIMVGDRFYDAEGAREQGLDTVGVLCGYGSREEFEGCGVAYIAENMKEVLSVILSKEN